jgi:hypothetical protein
MKILGCPSLTGLLSWLSLEEKKPFHIQNNTERRQKRSFKSSFSFLLCVTFRFRRGPFHLQTIHSVIYEIYVTELNLFLTTWPVTDSVSHPKNTYGFFGPFRFRGCFTSRFPDVLLYWHGSISFSKLSMRPGQLIFVVLPSTVQSREHCRLFLFSRFHSPPSRVTQLQWWIEFNSIASSLSRKSGSSWSSISFFIVMHKVRE